jgi:hypothetical protein
MYGRHRKSEKTQGLITTGGCGYRVFAKPAQPEKTCTVVCQAAPHDANYFIKINIWTNSSVKLIDISIGFSLSNSTVSDMMVHDASSKPVAAVVVSGHTGGDVFININTGDKCDLWHGMIEGSAAGSGAAAVGYKNLVVTGFFTSILYDGYGAGSNFWIIGTCIMMKTTSRYSHLIADMVLDQTFGLSGTCITMKTTSYCGQDSPKDFCKKSAGKDTVSWHKEVIWVCVCVTAFGLNRLRVNGGASKCGSSLSVTHGFILYRLFSQS